SSTYDPTANTIQATTPRNRTSTASLDPHGRITQIHMNGLSPVAFNYGSEGRITSIVQGTSGTTRTTLLSYGTGSASAYLSRIPDPLGRQMSFTYDLAGRAVQQILPGARTINYGYDAAGRVTSLTPPGESAYTFTYAADGQLTSVTPPAASGGG